MIKARAGNNIIIGLSDENVRRLQDNQPIFFKGEDVGLPGITVTILHGETEQKIAQDLMNKFGYKPN